MRGGEPSDLPLVFNSWLKSYRKSDYARDTRTTAYFAAHAEVIRRILARGEIVIACDADDVSHVYGYLVAEAPNVCHFVYVKYPYRAMGIGTRLLDFAFGDHAILASHSTRAISEFRKRGRTIEYVPQLMGGSA